MPRRTYPDLPTFLTETDTTQERFARRLGISQSYMSKIISGKAEPPLTLALRITKAARVPMESLVRASCRNGAGNVCV